ncbi:MAG: Rieske 2Fe-2S domain-containing protein [Dehalococcoidia bacterium]
MGELFRRYWHPILLSSDLPQPDAPPVKVTLLSENLVAFRNSRGRVGLLEEACPHRGLPLSNGVNANDRLTCIYHRWAFDVTGACVDELPGADQWRAKAYPTLESAGMIWTYMGPPEEQPPSPSFIANVLPPEHVVATRASVRSTYLKAVVGTDQCRVPLRRIPRRHDRCPGHHIRLSADDAPAGPRGKPAHRHRPSRPAGLYLSRVARRARPRAPLSGGNRGQPATADAGDLRSGSSGRHRSPGTGGVEIPFHTIPSEQITFGLNDEPRSVAVG